MTASMYSRRSIVKLIVTANPLLSACSTLHGVTRTAPRSSGRRLSKVLVSPDRVIRHVVGLRPFRRSGFNVSIEQLGDKALVHNYGHGGGGISLSWGTSFAAR